LREPLHRLGVRDLNDDRPLRGGSLIKLFRGGSLVVHDRGFVELEKAGGGIVRLSLAGLHQDDDFLRPEAQAWQHRQNVPQATEAQPR
jgi:hypothetical protein